MGTPARVGRYHCAMSEARAFVVAADEAGLRLDQYLALALGVSRAEARRVLARGGVAADGRAVTLREKGRALRAGAALTVAAFAPPALQRPRADASAPLHVLARGAGWLAVNKPAGVPVHPLAENETGTLLSALVARHPEVLGVGEEGGLRSGVVHRLDVETSGVMLFATTPARWRQLRDAFRRHRVRKLYRALVHGALAGEGELALQLAMARSRPARVRVVTAGARDHGRRTRLARTSWRAVAALRGATLVEVQPRGGFLHQIRVSLAHIGHPIIGDTRYGGTGDGDDVRAGGDGDGDGTRVEVAASRALLHAAHIAYDDIEAHAPDAKDFADALKKFT